MNWVRTKRIGAVLLALFLSVAFGSGLAWLVVRLLGERVPPVYDGYEIGVFLAVGAMVVLVIKDLLSAVLGTWSYIWHDDDSRPTTREISMWVIEAILTAAILTGVFGITKRDCPDNWDMCLREAPDLTRACFLDCIRNREVTYLTEHITQSKNEILEDHKIATLRGIASTPLLFENARTDGESHLDERSHGVALQPGHVHQLWRIVKVLNEACSSPNRDVTLRVVGSPSRAPFLGRHTTESDDLNLQLANLRARVVSTKLCEVLEDAGLGGVTVVAHEWKEFKEIRRSAFPGVDHISLEDPEHQARSVFVALDAPSACFRESKPMKEEDTCPRESDPPTS